MRGHLFSLALIAACHNADTDREHDDLRAEMFSVATSYRSTMCACKTAQCAGELDVRFQGWLQQMQAKIAESDRRNSYSAKIGEDAAKKLKGIFDAYDSCKLDLQVRAEIHR